MQRRIASGAVGAAGLWLVAVALLFRALIPSGFMLAPVGGEAWRIILCTANGATEAYVDADGRVVEKPGAPTEESADQPCAFAGLLAAALTPSWLPVLLAFPSAPILPTLTIAIGRGLAAPPPPATGPPAIV